LNNDNGDGYKKTCKIFDCKKSTLRDWIKRYKTKSIIKPLPKTEKKAPKKNIPSKQKENEQKQKELSKKLKEDKLRKERERELYGEAEEDDEYTKYDDMFY
jgi:transposase-like protein